MTEDQKNSEEQTLGQKIGSYNFHRTNFNQLLVLSPIMGLAGYQMFGKQSYDTFRPEVPSQEAIQTELLQNAFDACIANYTPTPDGQLICDMPTTEEISDTVETIQETRSEMLAEYNAKYGPYEEPVSVGIGLALTFVMASMAVKYYRGKKKLEKEIPDIAAQAKLARKGIWPEESNGPSSP